MNHLSLFTGAGGGDLAHQHLLNFKTIGYVENNLYCTKILRARIDDGFLDEAPIFGDIRQFIKSGAVKKYQGFVEVVTAGFPCQPFSVAGKKKGKDDERNLWPETLAVIRAVRPRYALLENVPGLLNSGYFPEILGSLAESGFDVRWDCISAAAVGAPHRRDRLWILAKSQHPDTYSVGSHRAEKHQHGSAESTDEQVGEPGSVREVLADSDSDDRGPRSSTVAQGRGPRVEHRGSGKGQSIGRSGEDVADSESEGLQGRNVSSTLSNQEPGPSNPRTESGDGRNKPWPTEPNLGRVVPNGLAHRVDRLKAIGNGQVPRVVATAWRILND